MSLTRRQQHDRERAKLRAEFRKARRPQWSNPWRDLASLRGEMYDLRSALKRREAHTVRIGVERADQMRYGPMLSLHLAIHPEEFRASLHTGQFEDVSQRAAAIGYETGRKVELALVDYVRQRAGGL